MPARGLPHDHQEQQEPAGFTHAWSRHRPEAEGQVVLGWNSEPGWPEQVCSGHGCDRPWSLLGGLDSANPNMRRQKRFLEININVLVQGP